MRKHPAQIWTTLAAAGLGMLLLSTATMAQTPVINLSGPTQLWVPYDDCATATYSVSTNFTPLSITWKLDGAVVGSGTTYSRRFCSPRPPQIISEDHDVHVETVITSQVSVHASKYLQVIFLTNCGYQLVCF